MSQDFIFNIKILQEVFCGNTGQRQVNLYRQHFEMKYLSFDQDVIDMHFQKMAKILLKLGKDPSMKQAFVSSLPKMLVGHIIMITKKKIKSIIIPHMGYIRQIIFQALDNICIKIYILKQIIQNNPSLDRACRWIDFFTKSHYPFSSL